jgi:hypothetical protein
VKYSPILHEARAGKDYLLFLKPREKADEPFQVDNAGNSAYDLEKLEENGAALLSAITPIMEAEAISDKNIRSKVHREMLQSQNHHLQMYAFRSLCRSLYLYSPDNPLDRKDIDDLQAVLATLVSDTQVAVNVREYALHELFFFDVPGKDKNGEKIWPGKLISACLAVAETDGNVSIRKAAVKAIWGMCQTGLLGPKKSYETALPPLAALFQKEADSEVSKTIAMAITVIGSMKHKNVLDRLEGLSKEKLFYVTKIKEHWIREGGRAISVGGKEFDFPGNRAVQPEDSPDER